MLSYRTNRRLCNIALWLFAACIVAVIVAGCSPYSATATVPTQTPTAAQLLFQNNKATPTPRPSCQVDAGTVYLRSGAGMSYAPKQILRSGERLAVIYRAGAWLFVSTRNHAGYIASRYCEAVKETNQ
jgi:uncharacterized protein YgiM (DUF1202 family)